MIGLELVLAKGNIPLGVGPVCHRFLPLRGTRDVSLHLPSCPVRVRAKVKYHVREQRVISAQRVIAVCLRWITGKKNPGTEDALFPDSEEEVLLEKVTSATLFTPSTAK